MIVHRLERALSGGNVESDFGRVNFQREADAALLEDIEDRSEAFGKILVAGVNLSGQHRRKAVAKVPDAAAGKAVHHFDAETLRGLRGLLEFFRGTLAYALGFAVAVDVVRQDGLVTFINEVADRLSHEVRADGVALEPGFAEESPLGVAVLLVGFGDFEMIA